MEIYHVQLPNPRDIVLLDFYVENIGSDEFGPVKDAWMRVRGFCIKIVHRIGGDGMGLIKGYHEDGPKDMPFLGHVDVCREFEEGGIYGHSDGVEFTLLQVSRWMFGHAGASTTYSIACLMLAEVEGRAGAYKRVGMVYAYAIVDSWDVWEEKELALI